MARFTSFDDWSAWMQTVIKENGVGAITGSVLQEVLGELSDTAEWLVNISGSSADGRALAAEGYAVGTQRGVPVEEGSPYYHNNAKYWAEVVASRAAELGELTAEARQAIDDANAAVRAAAGAAHDATEAAGLAEQKAGLANDAAELATQKAGLADDAATNANEKAAYAKDQGDYAKGEIDGAKGDYESLDARFDHIEEENDAIRSLIPAQASADNKLADRAYVNDKVSTDTATFRGTFNLVTDLSLTTEATQGQIAMALGTAISGEDNNDYAFVQIPTSDATPTEIARIDRYKYTGLQWAFEYSLNNSGFTAEQWAAINSGITSSLVTVFGAKYDKPAGGIPASDMNTSTFDDEPTPGSDSPVKSEGVYMASKLPIFDFTKSVYNRGTVTDEKINGLIEAVKSCKIYGGKNGYTYSIFCLSRNITTAYVSNSYHFYLHCVDKSGNYAVFWDSFYLNDKIAAEGLLQEVVLHPNTLSASRITSGTLTIKDLPSEIVFWIDYSVVPDNGYVGELLLASALRLPFSDVCHATDTLVNTCFDFNSPYFVNTGNTAKDYAKVVKSIDVYGALDGYTYTLKRLSRKTGTNNDQYYFWVNMYDKNGNETQMYKILYLSDTESTFGTLLSIELYDFLKVGADSSILPNQPSKVIITIDYSQIKVGGFVGNETDIIPISNEFVHKENDTSYSFTAPYFLYTKNPTLYNPSGSHVTPTTTGYVIDAGVTSNVFFGFRVSNAVNSDIKELLGKTVPFKMVLKFTVTDGKKPIIDANCVDNNISSSIGTFSNKRFRWVNGYCFIEWDWTFPSTIPATYSGQIFTRIKTTNNTSSVAVDYEDTFYKLPYDKEYQPIALNPLTLAFDRIKDDKEDGETKHHIINVSRDGTSTSGRTIQFSGLTAISDALNSISDNSEKNRYTIHVEGEFRFTDPLTVPMFDGTEYSIVLMKDYVDIEGDGPSRSAIILDIAPNSTFHTGKSYSDYQPIYFYGVQAGIKGLKVIGKNCRYAIHIEHGDYDYPESYYDKEVNIDNCYVEYLGHPDYTGSYADCLGTGISSGQVWNIKNSILRGTGIDTKKSFSMHTPLKVSPRPCFVNFENCHLDGQISLHNYDFGNVVFVNMTNCHFDRAVPKIVYPYYNSLAISKKGDYTGVLIEAIGTKALFEASGLLSNNKKGAVLRVVALSTGNTSVVSFDTTSSAFNVIVGNSSLSALTTTTYYWDTQYGYVYRNGCTGISGQAFGTIDIDESNTSTDKQTLGKLLGDCTSTNKTLGIVIDGTTYNVVFNENYTSKDNAYIIGKINNVIGNAGTADVFCPAKLYYPEINGFKVVEATESIIKGMGVVLTSSGIRKAKNSDGYIDGIALDDFSLGQTGRIITEGYIYRKKAENGNINFYCYDDQDADVSMGTTFGIDPDNDGQFKMGANPTILRSTDTISVKIL